MKRERRWRWRWMIKQTIGRLWNSDRLNPWKSCHGSLPPWPQPLKTWPSRLDLETSRSQSLLFDSSDLCWSPFMFNVRELAYLWHSLKSPCASLLCQSNPLLKLFFLHCLHTDFQLSPPSNSPSIVITLIHFGTSHYPWHQFTITPPSNSLSITIFHSFSISSW